jgi:hypothetical protein
MISHAAVAAAAPRPDNRVMDGRETLWARYLVLEMQHGHGTSVALALGLIRLCFSETSY